MKKDTKDAKKAAKPDKKENEVKLSDSEENNSEEGSESSGEGDSESEGSDKSEHESKNDKLEQHARTILYEDEKYEKECEQTVMAYQDIQNYMDAFVDY